MDIKRLSLPDLPAHGPSGRGELGQCGRTAGASGPSGRLQTSRMMTPSSAKRHGSRGEAEMQALALRRASCERARSDAAGRGSRPLPAIS